MLMPLFLFLALFPRVHGAFEAWEHSHHSHAAACEEDGAHMHPQEAHCQLDHFAFFSTPWEVLHFYVAPLSTYPQRVQTGYTMPYAARYFGKTDARGPPCGSLFANV